MRHVDEYANQNLLHTHGLSNNRPSLWLKIVEKF